MNPYVIIGGLVLLIGAWFGGSYTGAKVERATWQKKEIALMAAYARDLEKEITNRDRERQFNEAKARKASENHEKALTKLKSEYTADLAALRSAGGLRIPKRWCPPAASPGIAAGTSGPDESASATEALPERTQEGLFSMTEEADQLAERLRALQNWIRDNGLYGPAK